MLENEKKFIASKDKFVSWRGGLNYLYMLWYPISELTFLSTFVARSRRCGRQRVRLRRRRDSFSRRRPPLLVVLVVSYFPSTRNTKVHTYQVVSFLFLVFSSCSAHTALEFLSLYIHERVRNVVLVWSGELQWPSNLLAARQVLFFGALYSKTWSTIFGSCFVLFFFLLFSSEKSDGVWIFGSGA